MPRQARQRSESDTYHVLLRGVNKDAIFLEDEDCEQFLQCLRLTKAASGCVVLAYCLMTNHVHLVLQTPLEPISAVMKRLGVRYVGWFNRKYARVGHLYQNRFASLPVEDDAYLITLLRYVWSNPVKAGLAERSEDYPWCSRSPLRSDGQLVDIDILSRLVPADVLATPVDGRDATPSREPARRGRPTRHSDDQVAELLRRCSGAHNPQEFAALDAVDRRRVIRELRTRAATYDQIARATGLSVWQVRRAQVVMPG
jgi:Transposase and inactivated derivatives